MTPKEYEYKKKYEKWKEENNWPDFEPDSRCYYCGRNIYADPYIQERIDEGVPVTGCPYCHHSFVE